MRQTKRLQGDKEAAIPPYISYLTFVNFLDWLKSMPAIPTQIDRSLWASKFSGSTGPQLMVGLRFLKLLVDGNKTAPLLGELAKADSDQRQELIRQVLRDAYGSDYVDNLATKTLQMVNDRLKELGTTEATHNKARSFFINACKSNGVVVPSSISKQARIRRSRSKATKTLPPKSVPPIDGKASKQSPLSPSEIKGSVRIVQLQSGGSVSLGLSVDPFDLSLQDREWVFKLIDMLKAYGKSDLPSKRGTTQDT